MNNIKRVNRARLTIRWSFLILLIFGVAAELTLLGGKYLWLTRDERMGRDAERILSVCRDGEFRPTCYDREIPKLMRRYSMEDVFAVTKRIQEVDTSYAYCHVLGHALSATETKKDPERWQEVVARCPSGVCSNGCVHGAFQERFRRDVLTSEQITAIKPDLLNVCEARGNWHPTGMEQATCYHALGHLLMYITGADIAASVGFCDELAGPRDNRDFRNVCYDGVYMQMFQPLEPEDRALIRGREPTRESVLELCNAATGAKRGSCVSESWPLYVGEMSDPAFVEAHCGKLDKADQPRCHGALFYVLVVQLRFDLSKMRQYCESQSGALVGRCFGFTASRLVETDWANSQKAVAWCLGARDEKTREACFEALTQESAFQFPADSLELLTLCDALPGGWGKTCRSKSEVYKAFAGTPGNPAHEKSVMSKLLTRWGSAKTYQVIKSAIRDASVERQHGIAHLFGELLYGSDGVLGMTVCDDSFGFGCYHSFFGAAVRDKGPGIIRSLEQACVKKYGTAGLGCPHGLGHGLGEFFGPMRLREQLAFCGKLTWRGRYFGCSGGVFMEYFMPLTTKNTTVTTTARPFDRQQPYSACDTVEARFQPSCFMELGGWWVAVLDGDFTRMGELCEGVGNTVNRESCFLGVGLTAATKTGYEPQAATAACSRMPQEFELLCRAGASWGFFSDPKTRSKAADLCGFADDSKTSICQKKADLLSI